MKRTLLIPVAFLLLSTMACKSAMEIEQPDAAMTETTISVQGRVGYVDSVLQFTVIGNIPFRNYYFCSWSIDSGMSILNRQNVDTVSFSFHEQGIHRIQVQVFDSASNIVTTATRIFLISEFPLSSLNPSPPEYLPTIHNITIRVSGAFVRKTYSSYYDLYPHSGIDTSDFTFSASNVIADAGMYYTGSHLESIYTGAHYYSLDTSNLTIRFSILDSGKWLVGLDANYHTGHTQQGAPAEWYENTKSLQVRQASFLAMHHDTLEYQLSGSAMRTALTSFYNYHFEANHWASQPDGYSRYSCDSIDWDNKAHPPVIKILLY